MIALVFALTALLPLVVVLAVRSRRWERRDLDAQLRWARSCARARARQDKQTERACAQQRKQRLFRDERDSAPARADDPAATERALLDCDGCDRFGQYTDENGDTQVCYHTGAYRIIDEDL